MIFVTKSLKIMDECSRRLSYSYRTIPSGILGALVADKASLDAAADFWKPEPRVEVAVKHKATKVLIVPGPKTSVTHKPAPLKTKKKIATSLDELLSDKSVDVDLDVNGDVKGNYRDS